MLVSIAEYREVLKDYISTDEQVGRRIEFLESLSRELIRQELKQKHSL